jgi:hypothetical protein
MNKGQIRSHFKALLNRSDCTDALADTFIDQAINRIERVLRIPPMERQQSYAVSSGVPMTFILIPSDLLETIDIQYGGVSLLRLPLHEMAAAQDTGEVGNPLYFSRERGIIKISPHPTSGTVFLNYYGSFPPLTDDTSTNILTQIASDLLTYTALSYASDYFLDERGPLFDAKSGQFLLEIQDQANSAESSGMAQVMRPTSTYTD